MFIQLGPRKAIFMLGQKDKLKRPVKSLYPDPEPKDPVRFSALEAEGEERKADGY